MPSTPKGEKYPQSIFWVILGFIVLLNSAIPILPNRPVKKVEPIGPSLTFRQIRRESDLNGLAPADFLRELARKKDEECVFWIELDHWITKKDVPALLALADSKEPCGAVAMAISSVRMSGYSTVGDQALFMLEGLRKGQYPPGTYLEKYYGDKSALIAWANAQE
jgi:hypothetical protein